mgnify:FL=1
MVRNYAGHRGSHRGKHIKRVDKVVERALRTGSAIGDINRKDDIDAERIYRAEKNNRSDGTTVFKLYHYNTLILRAVRETTWREASVQIGRGAFSVSDRNAINTALDVLGLPRDVKCTRKGGDIHIVGGDTREED